MGLFVSLLQKKKPLQIVGVPNALFGKMAENLGYSALYLSGSAIAANQFALPDLGLLSLDTLLEEARRIRGATSLPLVVDIDNGWDHPLLLEEAKRRFSSLENIALQIEDQAGIKRCGHREGISLVSPSEMVSRIQALRGEKIEIVARTDALSIEGLEKTIERCHLYTKAGADLLFVEAVPSLEVVKELKKKLNAPLLLNLTEFGKTPSFSYEEMADLDVEALLYPVSLSRVLWKAGENFLKNFKNEKSAAFAVPDMLSRKELYELLDYERLEKSIDRTSL